MEQEKKKRKTTTSTAVKARYNAKAYTPVALRVRKDSGILERIDRIIKPIDQSRQSYIIDAVLQKLEQDEKPT